MLGSLTWPIKDLKLVLTISKKRFSENERQKLENLYIPIQQKKSPKVKAIIIKRLAIFLMLPVSPGCLTLWKNPKGMLGPGFRRHIYIFMVGLGSSHLRHHPGGISEDASFQVLVVFLFHPQDEMSKSTGHQQHPQHSTLLRPTICHNTAIL